MTSLISQFAPFLSGAILLLTIAQTALARDPALPPGLNLQTAIKGAHHIEKRSAIRWLAQGVIKKWEELGYIFFEGRFFGPHARTRLCFDPLCEEKRMTAGIGI